jgi:hypothetical protein
LLYWSLCIIFSLWYKNPVDLETLPIILKVGSKA